MKLQRMPHVPIAGPRRIPLIGPAGSLLRFFRDPIRCMRDIHRRFGLLAAVSEGDPSLVCAFGPEHNHQLLSNPDLFHNAAELPIRVPEGTSLSRLTTFLVGMNGDAHHRLRHRMQPLFQRNHLQSYRNDMVEAAEGELRKWRPGETLDISEAMADLSLCVSFRCLFGLDISGEARSLADASQRFIEGATSPTLILFPYQVPGSPYQAFMNLCNDLETRLRALIRERRSGSERRDALSLLIAAHDDGSTLPDSMLVGLANELFIAGHKTTASTLAWTLFLLERHPKILADLLDELTGVLHGDAPTIEQLDKLPLLDAVVKESMRILPAAPFLFFRRTTEPVRVGSYELPPGAAIVISPLVTHHLPDLYPEPLRFRPERWSTRQPTTYEYLPFGAGPRTCLGAAFATVSLRVLLSLVLQRFKLSLKPFADVSFRMRGTILGTKNGMPMLVGQKNGAPGKPQPIRGDIRELVDLPS